ncbi:6206_t:CDS:1, partial [Dentiscutata heterogama]
FCFIKIVSGNDKFVTKFTLYCITDDDEEFREIIYKGFAANAKSLISNFEKNSIVYIVGRYIYNKNIE